MDWDDEAIRNMEEAMRDATRLHSCWGHREIPGGVCSRLYRVIYNIILYTCCL